MFRSTPEGIILNINSAYASIFGYTSPEELLTATKNVIQNLYFDQSIRPEVVKITMESPGPVQIENKYIKKDGSTFIGNLYIWAIWNEKKELQYLEGFLEDITERKKSEHTIIENEGKYKLILENAGDVIWTYDLITDSFKYMSPSVEKLRGFTVEEAMKQSIKDVLTEKSYLYVMENIKNKITEFYNSDNKSGFLTNELEQICKDGSIVYTEVVTTFLTNSHGQVTGILGITRDITERKKIEEALRASEAKYRRIIDTTDEGIWMMDADFVTTFVNKKTAEIVGYSINEMIGRKIDSFMFNEDLNDHKEKMDMRKEGLTQQYERRGIRKDGKLIWVTVSATPIFDDNGNFTGSFAMLSDITERKKAEEALRKSEEKYRNIFENAIEGIYQTSPEGRYLTVNPSFAKIFGYSSPEEMIAAVDDIENQRYVNHQDRLKFKEIIENNNKIKNFEAQGYRKDGETIWISINGITVRNEENKILYYEGTIEDITIRKRAEETLRESELFTRTILESISEGLIVYDTELRYVVWNPFVEEFTGVSADYLLGKKALDVFPGLIENGIDKLLHRALKGETCFSGDIEYNLPSTGKKRWYSGTYSPHRNTNGQIIGVVGFIRDVTEHKEWEESLKKEKTRLETASAAGKVALWEWHIETGKIEWSYIVDSMLGYEEGEFQRTISSRENIIHPEDREQIIEKLKLHIKEDIIYDEQYRVRRKDGVYIWWHDVGSSQRDASGKAIKMSGACVDITEIKKLSEERLDMERRLLHSQKLESLGVLAGGIAHDFNNLLMAIHGNLELALMDIEPFSTVVENIKGALTATKRASDLTRQMLAYSGKGRFVINRICINKLIDDNYHLLKTSITKPVILNLNLKSNLPKIEGDKTQIQQIIMNLIINASEAIGERPGAITISTGIETCDSLYLKKSRAGDIPAPGAFIYLEVVDTGCGMDKKTQDKLFEPFFTTKFTGRGLGMSAVLGIVRGHKGAIMVDSISGKGTAIRVLFPLPEQCN